MNLTLAPGILDDVIEHAKACYPKEGCGLLTPSRFIPVTNTAASASEFEMDPAELIGALRNLREAGEKLTGIYHSHPHGPARPSRTDIERAYYPEVAHLIVSLAELERPRAAAFRVVDGEALEIELHAIV
jgi:proteasome lid subunit RPN8/RPN11